MGRRVREQARYRCGYCLCREALLGMPMEVEHLVPLASGGRTVEENLWLSCRRCNEFKGTQTNVADPETSESVALFNPRKQSWDEHFRWNEDGTEIVGLTPNGRATVTALKLNNPVIIVTRRLWISAGWWPPSD
ncbi:MAG TPA: HNH endonuclease signature motif containing protein [Candidatus Binatia bacterium]|nr:HNH endonuclease signature motif containing protein [Candidatus Binatia bacterium]